MTSDHGPTQAADRSAPTEPAYPFGGPGEDVDLFEGRMRVAGHEVSGRVWMRTRGGTDLRWEVSGDDHVQLSLAQTRLQFEHSRLGPVDLPGRVTSSHGRGVVLPCGVGGGLLDEVTVHWVNLPALPADGVLSSPQGTWVGRWQGEGGGWSLTVDARYDLTAAALAAREDEGYALTHTSLLRRTNRKPFTEEQATQALYGWQVALSFAVGRWVAPALAVGSLAGDPVWELWSQWRCDPWWPAESWWNISDSEGLNLFARLFLNAWTDPDNQDRVRHVAHHVIESNKPSMTLEARIMLVGAALEYLSWATQVLGRRRSATKHRDREAKENLRELLDAAAMDRAVPVELGALEQLRVERATVDAPETVAWLRNRLVHPKDAAEPYRIEHLVVQAWQLLMQYAELLLLHDLGYDGGFCKRFPPGRWATDSQPVPWATT